MSQQPVIDSLQFSQRSECLSGSVPLVQLARLMSELESSEGVLEFSLQGATGSDGEPLLHLVVNGLLQLRCKRCLQPVGFPVVLDTVLELLDEERIEPTQEELEDDSRDFLAASRSMNVVLLIEDEVLLALPVAPRHDKCSLPDIRHDPEAASPFGVLLEFKGRVGKMH